MFFVKLSLELGKYYLFISREEYISSHSIFFYSSFFFHLSSTHSIRNIIRYKSVRDPDSIASHREGIGIRDLQRPFSSVHATFIVAFDSSGMPSTLLFASSLQISIVDFSRWRKRYFVDVSCPALPCPVLSVS